MLEICGHRILVKQEKLEDIDPVYKSAKAAGIALAPHRDVALERKGVDKGTVVGVGSNAWASFDDGHQWCGVGDKICWVRHGGYLVTDPETEEEYICLNDEDVLAVIERKT